MLYFAGRSISGGVNLAAVALYTRLLEPASYGRYALVIAWVGFCQAVVFDWLSLGMLRFFSKHDNSPQVFLSTVAIAFLGMVALTASVGGIILLFWTDSSGRALVAVGMVLLWAESWFNLNRFLAQTRLLPIRDGVLSILRAALALGIGGTLIVHGFGTYGPILGLFTAALVSAVGVMWREWRCIRPGLLNLRLVRDLLAYGLPLAVTFALNFIVHSSDRILLGWLISYEAAGTYAAGYDLTQMSLTLLMMVVNLAAYPQIVRSLETEGQESARNRLRESGLLLLAVALPAAAGLAICAPNIAGVALGPAFRETGADLLPWIALATLIAGVKSYYFDLAFQLGRYTVGQVWVVLAAASINLALNLWWIPVLGLMGAVYATVVAYGVGLCLSWRLGRRVFSVPPFPAESVKVILAVVVMASVLWPTRSLHGWPMLVLQIGSGFIVYSLVLLLTNFYGIWGPLTAQLRNRKR
jgi:O-antigen/teichoic acid export membrane protein